MVVQLCAVLTSCGGAASFPYLCFAESFPQCCLPRRQEWHSVGCTEHEASSLTLLSFTPQIFTGHLLCPPTLFQKPRIQQMAKQKATEQLEVARVRKKKLQKGRVGYARDGNFRNFQKKPTLIINLLSTLWGLSRYMWGLVTALENHGER